MDAVEKALQEALKSYREGDLTHLVLIYKLPNSDEMKCAHNGNMLDTLGMLKTLEVIINKKLEVSINPE